MEKENLLSEEAIEARHKKFAKFEVPRCHITVSNLTVIPKEKGATKKLLDDVTFYAKVTFSFTLLLLFPRFSSLFLLSAYLLPAPCSLILPSLER